MFLDGKYQRSHSSDFATLPNRRERRGHSRSRLMSITFVEGKVYLYLNALEPLTHKVNGLLGDSNNVAIFPNRHKSERKQKMPPKPFCSQNRSEATRLLGKTKPKAASGVFQIPR